MAITGIGSSYRVEVDRRRQQLQQADQSNTAKKSQSDSVDISKEGRDALAEKMSAKELTRRGRDMADLPSLNSGRYGIMNDFEKIMSEFEGQEGTKTDRFDNYVNKMAVAYQTMADRIEEKYAASGKQKEYYIASDGNPQELTKEKEMEMLNDAYEAHSRFMAASTRIWSELQDFKAQIVYHSGGAQTEAPAGAEQSEKQSAKVEEQAYNAFMSAIREKNRGALRQAKGNPNQLQLDLDISSSARGLLNSIWDYYGNSK